MRPLSKILAAALLTLCSCSYNPNDYSCFSHIDPEEGWRYGDTFVYLPEIADSVARGTLSLYVRHTNDYPFSNLWVELQTQQRRDTICLELADVYGNWHGTGLGSSFQLQEVVLPSFTMVNEAPLRLRHIMRPDSVTGIEQVGLIFTAE